jgi:hypothetical protein
MATALTRFIDDVPGLLRQHQREVYNNSQVEQDSFRLAVLRQRFATLCGPVKALEKLAALQDTSSIRELDDAVPVLFQHTVYKSYPMPFLEKRRFDALTKWFGQLTTCDLSGVDARPCRFIDEWLNLLEQKTPLQPIHTTGTSGKLSFLPRTRMDFQHQFKAVLTRWQGVGSERDITLDVDNPGLRLPVIQPGYRHGYYMAQRLMAEQLRVIGDPERVESLYDDTLSPDVLSLAGRVMAAEARGSLDQLQIEPELLQRFRLSQQRQHDKAGMDAAFFDRVLQRFQGDRVMLGNTVPQLFAWAKEGAARGISGLFSEDSLISSGGGTKGQPLPDDWQRQIEDVVGAPLALAYGMSELCGMMNLCSRGHYHVPPTLILYVLDEHSGKPLPRRGQQKGRAAFFDLLPDTYWGGFITGDEISVNRDGGCSCGRQGEYLYRDIRRFSDKYGGEDKISCAGAPEAQEKAMAYIAQAAVSS